MLRMLPEGRNRAALELALQTALVVPLASHTGYSTLELLAACERARALADELGEEPDPAVLRALAIASVGRLWYDQGQALGEQLLARAGRTKDAILYTEANYVLGVTSFFQGEFARSRRELKQAIAHYDRTNSTVHIARYAQDPKAICLSRLALTLWFLGYPSQADHTAAAALTFAEDLAHPFSLTYCLYWTALVQQHCGRNGIVVERVQAAIDLAHAHEFSAFRYLSMSLQGWAMAAGDNPVEGMAQLRHGIDLAHASGAQYVECLNLILLAEQAGKVHDFAQGLQICDEVLAKIAQTGAHWCEAEARRIKAELLLRRLDASGGAADAAIAAAEATLRQALAVARSQAAKSLELRAAISLARLWRRTGRGGNARRLLDPIYGWFTEGFDTHDLLEAATLLAALHQDDVRT